MCVSHARAASMLDTLNPLHCMLQFILFRVPATRLWVEEGTEVPAACVDPKRRPQCGQGTRSLLSHVIPDYGWPRSKMKTAKLDSLLKGASRPGTPSLTAVANCNCNLSDSYMIYQDIFCHSLSIPGHYIF